jgi:hypothetical protein
MNDEKLRSSVKFHLFESVLMLFTLRAVPFIIAGESLLLREPAYTIIDRNTSLFI